MLPKYACALGCIIQLTGILILRIIPPGGYAILWLYAAVIGFGMGSWLPTMSMLTSSLFGLASYGTVFGMISLTQSIGGSIGPAVVARIYDSSHSYYQAFIVLACLYAVSLPAILAVPSRKNEVSKVSPS